jgi:hypothetical protein
MKERRELVHMVDFTLPPPSKMASAGAIHIGGTISAICHYMSQGKRSLTGPQIRAGRALAGWSAQELARESAVSLRTIRRAELKVGHTSMTTANDLAVRRALEAAGVEFIDENGGGAGVRLRKRHQPDKRK